MLSKYFDEDTKRFYATMISLQMKDFKNGKQIMTIGDAEFLYSEWNMATIFKNGKITFIQEEEYGN